MSIRHIVVECSSPLMQAKFWRAALGLSEVQKENCLIKLPGTGDGCAIFFTEVSGDRPTRGPFLLRLAPDTGTLSDEVRRLTGLGATVIEKVHQGWGIGQVTMSDPEGNEFFVESGDHEVKEAESRMSGSRKSEDQFWEGVEPQISGVSYSARITIP
ncbi:VOC family protein [Streptomyces sp. NPDC087422]|uniref:VOC family protein n=1 Tax=Streptomyces sp. NPDC087422 TaxID=3365786 RepID=UPI00382A6410